MNSGIDRGTVVVHSGGETSRHLPRTSATVLGTAMTSQNGVPFRVINASFRGRETERAQPVMAYQRSQGQRRILLLRDHIGAATSDVSMKEAPQVSG